MNIDNIEKLEDIIDDKEPFDTPIGICLTKSGAERWRALSIQVKALAKRKGKKFTLAHFGRLSLDNVMDRVEYILNAEESNASSPD